MIDTDKMQNDYSTESIYDKDNATIRTIDIPSVTLNKVLFVGGILAIGITISLMQINQHSKALLNIQFGSY